MQLQELFNLLEEGGAGGDEVADFLADYLQGGQPSPRDEGWEMYFQTRDQHAPSPVFSSSPAGPWEEVINGLLAHLSRASHPRASVVWALGKARDQRALPVLSQLLREHLGDPAEEYLVFQILVALGELPQPPLPQLKEIAKRDRGLAGENARRYFELHRSGWRT